MVAVYPPTTRWYQILQTVTTVKDAIFNRGHRRDRQTEVGYPTFLQTHVYHARFAQLQEEVLVFLILLIVNDFHMNSFAARRKRGSRGWKKGKWERRESGREKKKKVNL